MGDKKSLVRFTWCSHNSASEMKPWTRPTGQWKTMAAMCAKGGYRLQGEMKGAWCKLKEMWVLYLQEGERIVFRHALEPSTGCINGRGWAGTRVQILGVHYNRVSVDQIQVFWKAGWAGTQNKGQEKDVCGRLQFDTQNSARLHITDTHTKL